jgi:hypothetical protein
LISCWGWGDSLVLLRIHDGEILFKIVNDHDFRYEKTTFGVVQKKIKFKRGLVTRILFWSISFFIC